MQKHAIDATVFQQNSIYKLKNIKNHANFTQKAFDLYLNMC